MRGDDVKEKPWKDKKLQTRVTRIRTTKLGDNTTNQAMDVQLGRLLQCTLNRQVPHMLTSYALQITYKKRKYS
jgi:hypothetical protein